VLRNVGVSGRSNGRTMLQPAEIQGDSERFRRLDRRQVQKGYAIPVKSQFAAASQEKLGLAGADIVYPPIVTCWLSCVSAWRCCQWTTWTEQRTRTSLRGASKVASRGPGVMSCTVIESSSPHQGGSSPQTRPAASSLKAVASIIDWAARATMELY
jgi:hypothetical protein